MTTTEHQCGFGSTDETQIEEEWDDCSRAIVRRRCRECGLTWRLTLEITSLVPVTEEADERPRLHR
jgi:hypothetical protein